METSEKNIYTFLDRKPEPDPVLEYQETSTGIPLVIDNGSCLCRVGWANSPEPQLTFKNITAKPKNKKENNDNTVIIGNDVTNIEVARWQLKSQFDRNIVTQYDTQEQIFDYTFSHLGINTDGAVNQPIVMTEAVCNPNYCRQQMSELLFECYHVPQVAYGVDALFSLYKNHPKPEVANSLVISCGYQSTHVLPVINGRLDNEHCRRINIGGAHLETFMHRVLQLKYPGHFSHITYSRAEEIIKEHCKISEDYLAELNEWADVDYYEENVRKLQLPYTVMPTVSVETQKEKKEQQAKRLRDLREKRQKDQLIADEEKLAQLVSIEDLAGDDDDESFQKALEEFALKSAADLHEHITTLRTSIQKAKDRIKIKEQEASSSPNTVQPLAADPVKSDTPKKLKLDNEYLNDERRETDPEGWLNDIRKKRKEMIDARELRRQKRTDMAKRRTLASQQRMKIITQLAESHKNKKEDTFGMNDNDWNVYKEITKEGGDSDSEAEQEKLDELDCLLMQHDAEFSRNQEESNNATFDVAEYYRIHVSTEQIRIPELLFQPSMIGHEQGGIVETLDFVLKKYSADYQEQLVQFVFLTGSNASFPNFKARMNREMLSIRPFQSSFRVKVAENPGLDAWYGAKLWAQSSNLPLYSVTRQDYFEMGGEYLKENMISNRFFKTPQ